MEVDEHIRDDQSPRPRASNPKAPKSVRWQSNDHRSQQGHPEGIATLCSLWRPGIRYIAAIQSFLTKAAVRKRRNKSPASKAQIPKYRQKTEPSVVRMPSSDSMMGARLRRASSKQSKENVVADSQIRPQNAIVRGGQSKLRILPAIADLSANHAHPANQLLGSRRRTNGSSPNKAPLSKWRPGGPASASTIGPNSQPE